MKTLRFARRLALTLTIAGLLIGATVGSTPIMGLGLVGSILFAALHS